MKLFTKQQKIVYKSSISLSNNTNKPLTLHIEPWGSQIPMPPDSTFQIVAVAQEQGELEIDYQENDILVWAWRSSILTVFSNGAEIFC